MSKKYTIEIDASVTGEEEVKLLEQNLGGVATNAEAANTELVQLNQTTEEQSVAQEGLATATDRSTTSTLSYGIAAYNLGNMYKRNQGFINKQASSLLKTGGIVGFLKRNWKALAVTLILATLAMKAWNRLLQASEVYIASTQKALVEFQKTLESDEAWKIFLKNIELYVGEKTWNVLKGFRDFWDEFYLQVLNQFGGQAGKDAVRAGRAITEMLIELDEKTLLMAKTAHIFKNTISEQTAIMNDSTKSMAEREAAQQIAQTTATQLFNSEQAILELQKKIVQARINAGEETQKNKLEVARLEKEIFLLNKTYEKQIASIEIVTEKIEKETEVLGELSDASQNYLDILEQINKEKEEDLRLQAIKDAAYTAEGEEFGFEEEDEAPESPEVLEIWRKKEVQEEYTEWLAGNLRSQGGMWGEFFGVLKDLYDKDVKFSKLSNEQKLQVVAMTAQASLSVALELINQLGAAASDDFETQKKYQIAGATVSTLQGMISAFMGGVQTAPGPWGLVLGGILAAAAGAVGWANIKKIKNSTPESVPSSGSLSGSAVGSVSASAPSLSLVSPLTSGEEQLAGQIGDQTTDPQKAYVVGSDMTSQQELDRRIESNAFL